MEEDYSSIDSPRKCDIGTTLTATTKSLHNREVYSLGHASAKESSASL